MKINEQLLSEVKNGMRAVEHTLLEEDMPKLKELLKTAFPSEDLKELPNEKYYGTHVDILGVLDCGERLPEGMVSSPLDDFFEVEPAIIGHGDPMEGFEKYWIKLPQSEDTKNFIAECIANRAKIELLRDIEQWAKEKSKCPYQLIANLKFASKFGSDHLIPYPEEEEAYLHFKDRIHLLNNNS